MISSTRANSAASSWAPNRRCPSSERRSSTNSAEPVDSVVFDARRVEPHSVVRASGRSVDVVAQIAACRERRGLAHPQVSAAAMLPHPTGDWDAVTVTQGVNHRSNTHQVMAATGETMPPTMTRDTRADMSGVPVAHALDADALVSDGARYHTRSYYYRIRRSPEHRGEPRNEQVVCQEEALRGHRARCGPHRSAYRNGGRSEPAVP